MAKSQVKVQVTPYTNGLQRLYRMARDFPDATLLEFVDDGTADLRKGMLNEFREVPDSPSYPLFWEPSTRPEDVGRKPNTKFGFYSRAKTAFFASGGFGKGIPAPRSGKITRAWKSRTRKTRNGLVIEVTNDDPAFPFIHGDEQQTMLAIIGWRPVEVLVRDAQRFADSHVELMLENAMSKFFDFQEG